MKKIFSLLCITALFLLAGCYSKQLIPEEILQMPKHTTIHTAYNIWYTDPLELSCENMQQGKLLRFGTEVTIARLTEKEVEFIAEGEKFRMNIDPECTMIPTPAFIRRMFTSKTSFDLTEGVNPVLYEKMRRGVIAEGMTREQVLITCGYPLPTRTPSLTSDTWIYWSEPVKSRRVVFKNDKVSAVIILE